MSGTEIRTSCFFDDDLIYKIMYLVIKNASTRWTISIKDWGVAVNQFAILFDVCVSVFLTSAI